MNDKDIFGKPMERLPPQVGNQIIADDTGTLFDRARADIEALPNKLGVKIVSDGTSYGTKIVDQATGQELKYVMKASWELDAEDGLAKLTLTMINVPVEITGEARIVKPCVP